MTFNCVFVAFPCGGLGWVSDLCRLSYFYATLTHLRINAKSHQKYIRVSINKNPRDFYAILRLRRTRCMCDVSITYVWRLPDECAAYDAMQ